jgi:hypothetical protein
MEQIWALLEEPHATQDEYIDTLGLRLVYMKLVHQSGQEDECTSIIGAAADRLALKRQRIHRPCHPGWLRYLAFCLGSIPTRLLQEPKLSARTVPHVPLQLDIDQLARSSADEGVIPTPDYAQRVSRLVTLACGPGTAGAVARTIENFKRSATVAQSMALAACDQEEELRIRLFAFQPTFRTAIGCLVSRRAWLNYRRPHHREVEEEIASCKLDASFGFVDLVEQLEAFALKTVGHSKDLMNESIWQAFVDEEIRSGRLRPTRLQKFDRLRRRLAWVPVSSVGHEIDPRAQALVRLLSMAARHDPPRHLRMSRWRNLGLLGMTASLVPSGDDAGHTGQAAIRSQPQKSNYGSGGCAWAKLAAVGVLVKARSVRQARRSKESRDCQEATWLSRDTVCPQRTAWTRSCPL